MNKQQQHVSSDRKNGEGRGEDKVEVTEFVVTFFRGILEGHQWADELNTRRKDFDADDVGDG